MLKKLRFPSTFEIALLLSLLVFLLAVAFTAEERGHLVYALDVLSFWEKGFWELMEFTMQMILILVFGHTLALSKPINNFLDKLVSQVNGTTSSALLTATLAIVAGYLNWGFGLVLGAVLARKLGEKAALNKNAFNYPLVGATGYLGMLVWHGGLSGSAPLKVAESNHFLVETIGTVTINETIFSPFNLGTNLILAVLLLLTVFLLSKRKVNSKVALNIEEPVKSKKGKKNRDRIGYILGVLILGLSALKLSEGWSVIDLNYVNFILLGAGLVAFGSLSAYVHTLTHAVKGATDILIQFPFYAGILGMMKYSGLLVLLAENMVSSSSAVTFPVLSFMSAALVNFFVPSGGGQWAIQGPVMMEAAVKMGIPIPKMVMVFAFGDQVSNMLQPFWALPLLSITGLPAKEIFRYTLYFFFIALIVFIGAILFAV